MARDLAPLPITCISQFLIYFSYILEYSRIFHKHLYFTCTSQPFKTKTDQVTTYGPSPLSGSDSEAESVNEPTRASDDAAHEDRLEAMAQEEAEEWEEDHEQELEEDHEQEWEEDSGSDSDSGSD